MYFYNVNTREGLKEHLEGKPHQCEHCYQRFSVRGSRVQPQGETFRFDALWCVVAKENRRRSKKHTHTQHTHTENATELKCDNRGMAWHAVLGVGFWIVGRCTYIQLATSTFLL